jgi:hypothetical protein
MKTLRRELTQGSKDARKNWKNCEMSFPHVFSGNPPQHFWQDKPPGDPVIPARF